MADFTKAVEKTLKLEGGYSNNPADKGGPTNWGITQATARAYGYKGDMKLLTQDQAKAIYKKGYWDVSRLDDLTNQLIAENIFDVNVNGGTPIKWAQRALNAMNRDEHGKMLWPDLNVDGKIGNLTIGLLNYIKAGSFLEKVFLQTFCSLRANYFLSIVEGNPTQKVFFQGWMAWRVWLDVRK